MRFIYFILQLIATLNLLIIIFIGLTGVNVYKKYGKQIVEFLKQLLDCLKDSKAPYLIKQIKKAIRQADWEV